MLGAGTGFAPLLAMLEAVVDTPDSARDVVLMVAAKQRADIDPMTGEALQKLVAELVDVREDLRLKVLAAIDAKKAAAQQRAGAKKKKKKKTTAE